MALQGNGFFVVEGNGQTDYTRSGDFTVNSQGQLCTPQGQLVMGYPATNGVVSTTSALTPITVSQAAILPASATTTFSDEYESECERSSGRHLQHSYHGVRFAGRVARAFGDLHEYGAEYLELQHHIAGS